MLCFSLYLRSNSKYELPGAYIQRGLLTECFYMDWGFFLKILWYMGGCVSCWFSPLLREVFLQVPQFFPPLKNQHNLNSNSTRNQLDKEPHFVDMPPPNQAPYASMWPVSKVGILGFKCPAIHKPLILQVCCIACLYSLRYSSPMFQMLLLVHMARKQKFVIT